MVAAGRAHVENGKFSQNGLKMVLGYQGLRPWPGPNSKIIMLKKIRVVKK